MEDWARYSGRLPHAAKDDEGVTRKEFDERTIGKSTLLYSTTDNVHQSLINESGELKVWKVVVLLRLRLAGAGFQFPTQGVSTNQSYT